MRKTYLVTPGGSASTYLESLIGSEACRGMDEGFNKHTRTPPEDGIIIYLYSSPYDIIRSYYRQGFLNDLQACKNVGGNVEELDKIKGCSLKEFLHVRNDVFMFYGHFLAYFNRIDLPIVFFQYEALEDPKKVEWLFRLFAISADNEHVGYMKAAEDFEFKERLSDPLPEVNHNLYKFWHDKYQTLPELFTYNVER